MKRQRFVSAMIGVITLISWSCGPQRTVVDSMEKRIKQLEAAAPGVGELMSGVQLHVAKLQYAAQAKNWKLAGFEVDEIVENLDKASLLRPQENGVQLASVIEAIKKTQLEGLKKATEQRNFSLFTKTYDETIAACNSCHNATGRPFIVITWPTAPPVANQQWTAPAE